MNKLALLAMCIVASTAMAMPPTIDIDSKKLNDNIMTTLHELSHVEVYKVRESNVLLSDESPSKAKPAECQPSAGERVGLIRTTNDVDGITGLAVATVVVLDGRCKGSVGWTGPVRLEKTSEIVDLTKGS